MKTLVSAFVLAAVSAAQSTPQLAAPQTLLSRSIILPDQQPRDLQPARRGAADLTIGVSKSFVLDHATPIRRISIANGDIAEAVAVSPTEILLNGKSPGDTSLVIWDSRGNRSNFDVHVSADASKLQAVRDELSKEVGPDISLTVEGGNVFLRGTVKDATSADRAFSIASTAGKAINLLRVLVPPVEPQILLKVRFADVDRQAASQLGINLFGANLAKGIGNTTTGQFGQPPTFNLGGSQAGSNTITFTQLLNIFYYRPDIGLGAAIQALESKNVLQILAEPNLLTVSGRPASFLAGGQFPFPTLQGGGSGVGQITIQFKEFGIRLNFLPTVTPRGTIRLEVAPEVSSLDYANGLTLNGATVPGLATRRVQTEVELEDGQSFAIAGLLDNQVTEQLDKVPGLGNIPVLGKLFQTRSLSRSNSELLVLITAEIVRPIPASVKPPTVNMPLPFLKGTAPAAPQNPGPAITGTVPVLPKSESLPVEELKNEMQTGSSNTSPAPAAQPAPTLPPAAPASSNPANPQSPNE